MIDLKDIQRLKSLRILLIGDSCVDHYHYGVCERMSPEAPVPIFKVLDTYKSGGMAHNVKANLEGMGISVYLLTNDEEIIKSRYIDKKTRQHLLRTDWGEAKKIVPLKPKELDSIDFDLFDVVVISDYDKGFLTKSDIETICGKHNNVFIDSKKVLGSWASGARYIKINETEYKRSKETITSEIQEKIIQTRGAEGCLFRGIAYSVTKAEVKDVCGAGDSFLAALVVKFLEEENIEESIKYANYCASQVVTRRGVSVIP